MLKHDKLLVTLIWKPALLIWAATSSFTLPAAELTPIEQLGQHLFLDLNLSVNRKQSCESCHESDAGFTSPDSWINQNGAVLEGAVGHRFGNRKPLSAAYAGDSPVLYYNETEKAWIGGLFWDGRATGWNLGDPLAEQAQAPFLNPLEQAQPNVRQVIIRVAHSEYKDLFESVWGAGSLDFDNEVAGSYERIAHAIAAYERSTEVSPFTSKFDLFWENALAAGKDISQITADGIPGSMSGSGMNADMEDNQQDYPAHWQHYRNLGLDDVELQGLAIFNDTNRANCASCHTLTPGSAGYPLFTDFRYHNIGVPRNPENPFYTMPEKWNPEGEFWVDQGLGKFLESTGYPPEVYENELGKFKTPTLRNVDRKSSEDFVKAYGHNGFFKSLDGMTGIVHFYAWRAAMDRNGTSNPTLFPSPEVDMNRTDLQSFNFMMDGEKVIAFLKTLSDGYFHR